MYGKTGIYGLYCADRQLRSTDSPKTLVDRAARSTSFAVRPGPSSPDWMPQAVLVVGTGGVALRVGARFGQ